MAIQGKLIRRKKGLLELTQHLRNNCQVCTIHCVSRQHLYDIRKAHNEHGVERLRQKNHRRLCLKNRVVPEVQEAVTNIAYEYSAYGQAQCGNELAQKGILVAGEGVRRIWF